MALLALKIARWSVRQVLTALAAEHPALLEWHLARHKRALSLCIAQIGRDPDDGFDEMGVRSSMVYLSACLLRGSYKAS